MTCFIYSRKQKCLRFLQDNHLRHCLIVQVRVQHVHIDGLGRTKEDILTYEIADVFRAKNLIDVSMPVHHGSASPEDPWNCTYS